MNKSELMEMCVEEAIKGVLSGDGGPFGAIVVKDNTVVGVGHNTVVGSNDPTAHGEINAIRNACKNLETFDLSGCELYTSAEPCPMCASAIIWANINKVYYGCTVEDTNNIGFRDGHIYDWFETKNENILNLVELDRDNCLRAFKVWTDKQDRTQY